MTMPRFVSGRFCEIVDPDRPINWGDPSYFDVPTSPIGDNVNAPASRYFKLPQSRTVLAGKYFHLEVEEEQP